MSSPEIGMVVVLLAKGLGGFILEAKRSRASFCKAPFHKTAGVRIVTLQRITAEGLTLLSPTNFSSGPGRLRVHRIP